MGYKELKKELDDEFRNWVSELEKEDGWKEYEESVKELFPIGYERHPFTEGIKELEHWYFWHGRKVKNMEDFKKFAEEFLIIVYGAFQSNEYYKDLGLDGFLLKMKQGEMFKIGDATLFSIPESDNVRVIYKKGYERQYNKLECELFGLLDCRSNQFIVDSYMLDNLEQLLPDYKKEYHNNTPESRKIVKEL